MKFTLLPFLLFAVTSVAQTTNTLPDDGGEYPIAQNSTPCVSDQQYALIAQRCNDNAARYINTSNAQRGLASTALNWPLHQATGYNDCSYYFISAHVDQDTATGTIRDYNCGSITYDGHKGTDIAVAPFPFLKMDNSQVEVVAAAAGTIVDKHDGENDRNCVSAGSNLTANYVVLQHADGSRTLYLHMKKNSITTKAIGQTVAADEYLGVVGSSGSSSGPHLHFEVWAGSTVSTLVDPFSGTCNHLNGSSWWAAQKPYLETQVIKASTNTTDIVIPACGTTETPNEVTSFTIPFQGPGLSPGYAKFYIFMRNEVTGDTVHMTITKPDLSTYSASTHISTADHNFSYWGYSKLLPTAPGTYTFNATMNGITCSQQFDIATPIGINEINSATGIQISPNPFSTVASIKFNQPINNGELNIYNGLGQMVRSITSIAGEKYDLVRGDLPSGLYLLMVTEGSQLMATEKLMIVD